MNGAVVAAVITNATTAVLAILTAIAAIWRVGRNRRYERRIRNVGDLQDRSAVLRQADRDYNQNQVDVARNAAAQRDGSTAGATDSSGADFNARDARGVDAAQAVAYDAVRIAVTRLDEPVLVDLNERWRRLSRLTSTEVSTDDENRAWETFNDACSEALRARSGSLSRGQRRKWQRLQAGAGMD